MTYSDQLNSLFQAEEILHYIKRFKGQKMLCIVKDQQDFLKLTEDFRFTLKADIELKIIIFTGGNTTKEFNDSLVFNNFSVTKEQITPFEEFVKDSSLQVLLLEQSYEDSDLLKFAFQGQSLSKVILVDLFKKIDYRRRLQSYLQLDQVSEFYEPEDAEFLNSMYLALPKDCDLVLIPAGHGTLFKELYSYVGSGTLISNNLLLELTDATEDDIADLFFLSYKSMSDGIILPLTQQEIASTVRFFKTLRIDRSIVASLRLIAYDKNYEIAKLCTLPRYRGKGLARRLLKEVIAATPDAASFFALTKVDFVADLFLSLDFKEVEIGVLPEKWRQDYDLSRKSRAFCLKIN